VRSRAALLLIALAACDARRGTVDPAVADEIARREAFADALLADAGANAGKIRSSEEVRFEDGFSPIQLEPYEKFDGHAYRWIGKRAHLRLRTKQEPMELRVVGWVNLQVVHTRPNVKVYIEGMYRWRGGWPREDRPRPVVVDDKGFFVAEIPFLPGWAPPDKTWIDATIEVSSVGFHWLEPPELRVAHVFELEWKKKDPPPP
jgi:hypothetical protein